MLRAASVFNASTLGSLAGCIAIFLTILRYGVSLPARQGSTGFSRGSIKTKRPRETVFLAALVGSRRPDSDGHRGQCRFSREPGAGFAFTTRRFLEAKLEELDDVDLIRGLKSLMGPLNNIIGILVVEHLIGPYSIALAEHVQTNKASPSPGPRDTRSRR